MKKMSFLFFLLFSVNVCGQNILNGIGKIKLGMSFEEIREIVQSELTPRKHYWDVDEVRKFEVRKYKPIEGYYIENLEFSFYKNKLFMMESRGKTNIDEALTIKYGKPKTTIEEEPVSFTNGFGAVITKKNRSSFMEWNTGNKDITCEFFHFFSHITVDGDIYPNVGTSFNLTDWKTKRIVQKLDEQNITKAKREETEKLKKMVEGL